MLTIPLTNRENKNRTDAEITVSVAERSRSPEGRVLCIVTKDNKTQRRGPALDICQTGCFNADAQQEVGKSIGPVFASISDAQDVLMPRTLTDERISEANILLIAA